MRKLGAYAALAAMVLALGGAAVAGVKPGDPMPAFGVRNFDKTKVTADDLRGQVVIINLWATWCGPCKAELPLLDTYYRAHAKEGLRIFAVATENSVPPMYLQKLSQALAFPLSYPVSNHFFPVLQGVPTNYVIDRAGVVRYAKAAAFTPESLDALIGPLLAQPAPGASVTAANASR